MSDNPRHATGLAALDRALGGGLLPGALTVVVGATGIGKTQLGVHYAQEGLACEGRPGIFFDLAARGDRQSHEAYARRLFGWNLVSAPASVAKDALFTPGSSPGDYLHVFDSTGRRVTRNDLDFEGWQDWQAEMSRKLERTIGFLYGNFVRGSRRLVVDGIEPADRAVDSIQLDLFEYVYHQILRKDSDWVARDFFRQDFLKNSKAVADHSYDQSHISCLLAITSPESMLEDLLKKPLAEGDPLANANTLIYMGKVLEGRRLTRALYVGKHRGSACSDEIIPYRIGDSGLEFEE